VASSAALLYDLVLLYSVPAIKRVVPDGKHTTPEPRDIDSELNAADRAPGRS
jgi:hypothetical protein